MHCQGAKFDCKLQNTLRCLPNWLIVDISCFILKICIKSPKGALNFRSHNTRVMSLFTQGNALFLGAQMVSKVDT